jgi:hypothetical protein
MLRLADWLPLIGGTAPPVVLLHVLSRVQSADRRHQRENASTESSRKLRTAPAASAQWRWTSGGVHEREACVFDAPLCENND